MLSASRRGRPGVVGLPPPPPAEKRETQSIVLTLLDVMQRRYKTEPRDPWNREPRWHKLRPQAARRGSYTQRHPSSAVHVEKKRGGGSKQLVQLGLCIVPFEKRHAFPRNHHHDCFCGRTRDFPDREDTTTKHLVWGFISAFFLPSTNEASQKSQVMQPQ